MRPRDSNGRELRSHGHATATRGTENPLGQVLVARATRRGVRPPCVRGTHTQDDDDDYGVMMMMMRMNIIIPSGVKRPMGAPSLERIYHKSVCPSDAKKITRAYALVITAKAAGQKLPTQAQPPRPLPAQPPQARPPRPLPAQAGNPVWYSCSFLIRLHALISVDGPLLAAVLSTSVAPGTSGASGNTGAQHSG